MHRICPILCLLLLPLSARATPGRQAAAQEGLDRMLNEDYARAHAIFDSLATAEPERPEGYLGRAMAYWDASLIMEAETQYDPEIRRLIKQGIRVSENHIKAHGDSAEMFFWLGNAYGLRAALAVARGSVVEGVVDGLKGRGFLSEALRLAPDLVDARFGLGLSDYLIARKPKLLRLVNRLFSLPAGDREGGLAQLDRVAREGIYCRRHAVSTRAFLELYYEKNSEEARRRFADLLRRYPNSIDYHVRYLDALFALTVRGKSEYRPALIDSVKSIRTMTIQRGWKLDHWTHTKLIFIEGFGYSLTQNPEQAGERMETYVREAEKKSWLLGPAELVLGKLADLRGSRQDAIAHYKRALKRENVWGTHAQARLNLNRPFDGEEPAQRPPDLVRRYPERP